MQVPLCPECGYRLKVGANTHKGQRIICHRCKTSSIVVSLEPLEVELATLVNQTEGSKKKSLTEVPCPECDNLIKLSARAYQGQQVVCSACQTTLEVIDTDPIELDTALPVNLKWGRQRKKYNDRANQPRRKNR